MNVFSLRGHERPVRLVKFNTDGDLLFTCSDDGYVAIWQATTAKLIGRVHCKSAVKFMDISSDTKYLLTVEVATGFGVYDPLTVFPLIISRANN
jgi:translation initiation factor 3 subunit I